jgi:hypothetical protein
MKSEYNLNEDIIENICNRYNDIFVIETKDDYFIDDMMIGIIRMSLDVKKQRRYLKDGSHVLFPNQKVKWRSSYENDNYIVIVKSHWVKAYTHDLKLPVIVPVQTYTRNPTNNKKTYSKDYEEIEMNYNQYVKRRMIIDFHDESYSLLMAYDNHKKRNSKYRDYYKALNETAKHYMIEHETLKEFISKVNNRKKQYKKDWIEVKIKFLENKQIEKELDSIFNNDNFDLEKEGAEVINFSDLSF